MSPLRTPAGPAPRHLCTDVPAVGRVHARTWPGHARSPEPVVLVHGLGLSSRHLVPLGRRLAALGHRVLAPDLPGFGRSPRAAGTPWPGGPDVAEQTGHLTAWLDAVGVDRASFYGNSVGVQVAVELAARAPERVGRLVLGGPTPDPAYRSPLRQYPRVLRNQAFEAPSLQPVVQLEYLSAGFLRVLQQLVRTVDDPIEQRLPRVQAPTLVVRGQYDQTLSQAWAERFTALLPDGRLVVVEGAAHNVHWTAPAVTARLVHGFLTGDLVPGADGVVVPRPGADDPLTPGGRLPAGLHAVLDHLTAPALLTVPWLLGWSPRTRRLLGAFGALGLADALLTRYPGGLLRRIPLPVHLNLEASAGLQLLLAAATLLRGEPAGQRAAVAAQGLGELLRATATRPPTGPCRLVPVPAGAGRLEGSDGSPGSR
ncbi:alpha/beta fold hydrolase [Geodermatophilus sp. SYSU D00758]